MATPDDNAFDVSDDLPDPRDPDTSMGGETQIIANTSHRGTITDATTKLAPALRMASQTTTTTKALHNVSLHAGAKRMYRSGDNKWVTRDIAALNFLLNIPLQAEGEIVRTGWQLQQQRQMEEEASSSGSESKRPEVFDQPDSSKGKWWEKWVKTPTSEERHRHDMESELERPEPADGAVPSTPNKKNMIVPIYAPGRRLEGDEAIRVQIPLTTETLTRQKSIARQAALREWELQTAHGLKHGQPSMLDGRLFFSASGSYPVSVFSMIRYEPRKEIAILRRQKLEARGGGGSQFVIPSRDWRGISYRALLPRGAEKGRRAFNRFLSKESIDGDGGAEDDTSTSSESSEESDVYVPGMLDDPEMVLGRHRNVMIGDKNLGPCVCSTIQFVKPGLLKAELNKQFRERFDGWEPPRSARKHIGARVVDGEYRLIDPADEYDERSYDKSIRKRQGSVTSMSTVASDGPKEKQIRMPPSLTLSKIRSLKQQALAAAVKAKLEIGTVALACVYFERLCLDCRVDKSNRRLSFAACLLLASKINEPNVGLVMEQERPPGEIVSTRLQSLMKLNKRNSSMFASLLEFFTTEWSLKIKHLFDAEWGVFVALGFSLHTTPFVVAFHYRRLMRTLEWSPLNYLGREMYDQWQGSLASEEERRRDREKRRDGLRRRKEERLLNLHIEIEHQAMQRQKDDDLSREAEDDRASTDNDFDQSSPTPAKEKLKKTKSKKGGIKLLHRLGMRRSVSQERIDSMVSISDHPARRKSLGFGELSLSPSMPSLHTAGRALATEAGVDVVAIDMPEATEEISDALSAGSFSNSDDKPIVV